MRFTIVHPTLDELVLLLQTWFLIQLPFFEEYKDGPLGPMTFQGDAWANETELLRGRRLSGAGGGGRTNKNPKWADKNPKQQQQKFNKYSKNSWFLNVY